MMQILIVEDERPAALRLEKLVKKCRPEAQIVGMMESVKGTVQWLRENTVPSLIFLDIQLADNLSFEIFRQIKVDTPVIFTTAYDQYTLQAFKLNSIDYLLKPVEEEELSQALEKYHRIFERPGSINTDTINRIMQSFVQPQYKERFIVKAGQHLTYISIENIQYFYSEDGLAYAQMKDGKRHVIDYTMDALEPLLEPANFFRLNRKIVCNIASIRKISPYFNSRLILSLQPKASFDVIVSRERTNDFKKWLDR